jgi:flagellar hook assembly protein FlgD
VAIAFGQGDSAALIFSSPDLKDIFAYPNPYRSDSGQGWVTIAGLTRTATVRILDASGRLLRTLQETDGNGGVQWDLKDESGAAVASGIYIFYVVGEEAKGKGKLAVVR